MKVDLPLRIEIPTTPGEFKTGLMFRENLDTNSGMLFVFDRVAQQSFHMSHTTIPLDIAFIDEEGCIESRKSKNFYKFMENHYLRGLIVG